MVQHTMSRYIIEAAVDINGNLVTLVVKGEINEETGVWKCEMTDFLVDRRQKIQEGLDTQPDLFSESDDDENENSFTVKMEYKKRDVEPSYEKATDDEGNFGLPAFTEQEDPAYETEQATRGRRKK